jgi:DNA-binding MarR family transcriptional regulator
VDSDEPTQLRSFGQVETTLKLLRAVEIGGALSQRGFAARLGIALGLTNALIKRAVKKGLIKIKEVPARRYGYYLTPKGFAEKSRLSAEYISSSLVFFRRARNQYEDALLYCQKRGWKRVVLVGAGELTEIAILAAQSSDIPLVGVIDAARNAETFCGLAVYSEAHAVGNVDAYIIADARTPQQTFDKLSQEVSDERIFTPSILHVSRVLMNLVEERGDE